MLALLLAPAAIAACIRTPYFLDTDGDGYGSPAAHTWRCWRAIGYSGWSETDDDCDDTTAERNPDATDACDGTDQDCDGYDDGCELLPIAWGDLHVHTNLSQDGCEDVDNDCLPAGRRPGMDVFDVAEEEGLAFVALTDHAEVERYTRNGRTVDAWEATQDLLDDNDGGDVTGILGYEWSSPSGHRSVLLEDPWACDGYRVPARAVTTGKDFLGLETYEIDTTGGTTDAEELMALLADVENQDPCESTRYVVYYHHPALTKPASIDWSEEGVVIGTDTVVEIASEHGSSECYDLTAEGCDYHVQSTVYDPAGSVQAALQLGLRLGFVGGTDNHEGRPGTMDDGPGYIGAYRDLDGDGIDESARLQNSPGSVTGILGFPSAVRRDVFDAITLRHTIASTWIFSDLRIYAVDRDGRAWLPGDVIPAASGPLDLVIELDDPTVESWSAVLVDPWNVLSPYDVPMELIAGDIQYLRITAYVDGEEQRIWASPFFID